MSLQSNYDIFADAVLLQRLTAAILIAAKDVRAESAETANHASRITWANALRTKATAEAEAARMVVSVAANASVAATYASGGQASIPDGDIQFVVNSLIDLYAA